MNTSPQGSGPAASPAKFQHYREQSSVLEDVSAFRTGVVNYTGGETPEQLRSGQVSADYFRLFGAPVIRGRTFSGDEDQPRGPHVAVISEGLWQRYFGSDPNVIGRTVSLSGDPYVVIGIIGASFNTAEFGPPPEVWVPFQLDPNTTDQGHYFQAAGRLKPGVTLAQAQAKLKVSAQDFERKFPRAIPAGNGFTVTPFQEAFVGNVRPTLLILAGAVGLVLLIACANVANLLLVRAAARQREFAIRAAIGAGRGRIFRQLLTESVVLSMAGGVAGLALGLAAIRALLAVNTAGLPAVGREGNTGRGGLARSRIHGSDFSRHRNRVRPHPGRAEFEDRSKHRSEGNQWTHWDWISPEQGPRSVGDCRGGPGSDFAGRIGTADPHFDGAGSSESGVRPE